MSWLVLTHVQGYSDDVERHGGVSDTAERHRLSDRQGDRKTDSQEDPQTDIQEDR